MFQRQTYTPSAKPAATNEPADRAKITPLHLVSYERQACRWGCTPACVQYVSAWYQRSLVLVWRGGGL